jgi:hypothetical protein
MQRLADALMMGLPTAYLLVVLALAVVLFVVL